MLALHGLTGHGRRWRHLAQDHLPHVRFVAPDLRGHGRSEWTPPWTFETHVSDLQGVLDEHARGPVTVLGHSFGGALALHLAATAPGRVKSLVLLDPAIALPAGRMLEVADLTVRFPTTPTRPRRAPRRNTGTGARWLPSFSTSRLPNTSCSSTPAESTGASAPRPWCRRGASSRGNPSFPHRGFRPSWSGPERSARPVRPRNFVEHSPIGSVTI